MRPHDRAELLLTDPVPEIRVRVGPIATRALVDTGARISVVSERLAEATRRKDDAELGESVAITASGQRVRLRGPVWLHVRCGRHVSYDPFMVLMGTPKPLILGWDFLQRNGWVADAGAGVIRMRGGTMRLLQDNSLPVVGGVSLLGPDVVLGPALSGTQQVELRTICREASFSTANRPLGLMKCVPHRILTGTSPPQWCPLRRRSPREREIEDAEVEKMRQLGVIRVSRSPWASGVVLVPKKDGTTRFCVDYRKLNNVTEKDRHPLPLIQSYLAALEGAVYFSKLDAASGYWQIPLDEEAIPKTAFVCHKGLFEFVVMPFGLCNAPSTYQRAMQELLAGLIWQKCLVFVDDVLVFGRSWEEHCSNLREVLVRIRESGLLLKPSKCEFGLKKTEFLGHVVSDEGIGPDPAKVRKIREFPLMKCVRDVQAFLGLAGYYRRFIKDFAMIAAPLHGLTKLGTEWDWTPECSAAVSQLKAAILDEAVQAHPDFKRPFIIDCDASDVGMGFVLSQKNDKGAEEIVLVDSRVFTPAERKWHIREKEALGIIWSLEKSRSFVLGSKELLVRTDSTLR